MSAQSTLADIPFCPSCGDWWVDDEDFDFDKGFCKPCTFELAGRHPRKCPECSRWWGASSSNEAQKCSTCKDRLAMGDRKRASCANCTAPISGYAKGTPQFCSAQPCQSRYRRYKSWMKKGRQWEEAWELSATRS